MIVRVPASSANMGPGFDALGVALTLSAEVGLVEDDAELPAGALLADRHHPATHAFARLGGEGTLWVRSKIPMGRGLGYSAAVRVGGLIMACAQQAASSGQVVHDALANRSAEVLANAIELEGHADNAAAAVLGGVVVTTGDRSIRVPLQFDPAVVVWVPPSTTRTDESRTKMGQSVTLADAVFNIGHAAFLVAALASGDVSALRHGMQDRIHEPSRFAAAPVSREAYEVCQASGAWCAWLSGSGPTVAALCAVESAPALAAALAGVADGVGHTKILRIDHSGASLET